MPHSATSRRICHSTYGLHDPYLGIRLARSTAALKSGCPFMPGLDLGAPAWMEVHGTHYSYNYKL